MMWFRERKTEIEIISIPSENLKEIITLKRLNYTIKSHSTVVRPILAKTSKGANAQPCGRNKKHLLCLVVLICCIALVSLAVSMELLFEKEAEVRLADRGMMKSSNESQGTGYQYAYISSK